MTIARLTVPLACTLILAACQSSPKSEGAAVGAAAGAGIGLVAGGSFGEVVGAGLIGGAAGYVIADDD